MKGENLPGRRGWWDEEKYIQTFSYLIYLHDQSAGIRFLSVGAYPSIWMSKFIFSPEALCSARYCNQVADAWELAAGVHWFSLIITHRDYVIDLLGNHSFGNSAALRGAFSRLKSSNEQSIGQAIMSFRFPSSRDQSYAAVHFCFQLSLSPLRLTVACHRRNVSRPHPASRRYSDRPRRSHLMGSGDLIIRKIQSPFLAPVQSNVVEQFTVETLFPFLFPE